jgi:hypothetical protein
MLRVTLAWPSPGARGFLQRRFRHLPVVEKASGTVLGVLDITKCLKGAMMRLQAEGASSDSKLQEVIAHLEQRLGSSDALCEVDLKEASKVTTAVVNNHQRFVRPTLRMSL